MRIKQKLNKYTKIEIIIKIYKNYLALLSYIQTIYRYINTAN